MARPPAKTAWLLCLCILFGFLAEARAQTYSLSTDSSADVLTVTFPKNAPKPVVLRTGAKRVEVLFPAGTKLKGMSGSGVRGRHVSGLAVADNVLVVEMESDAFGFIASPKGDKAVTLQVFYDPAGSRWKPPTQEGSKPPETPQKDASAQPPATGDAGKQAQPPAQEALPQSESPQQGPPQQGPVVTGKINFPGQTPEERPQAAAARPQTPVAQPQLPAAPQAAPQQLSPVQPPKPQQQAASGQTPAAPPQAPQAEQASQPVQPAVPAPSPGQGVTGKIAFPGAQPQASATAPAQQAQQSQPIPQPAPTAKPETPGQAPEQPAAQAQGQAAPQPPKQPQGEVRGSINLQQPAPAPAPAPEAPAVAAAPQAQPPTATGQIAQPQAPEAAKGQADAAQPLKADEAAVTAITPKPEPPAAPPAPPKDEGKEKGESIEDSTYLVSGQQALARDDYDKALNVANSLLEKPELSKNLREDALYLKAEATFAVNKNKMPETFLETNDILQQALNFNTTSFKVPRALIKLGYINLRQGNLPEARAYFNLMRNKYPLDEEVPLIDVYWGDYYLDQAKIRDAKANHERAAQSFRDVLQKYPESRFARDAALGLSKALLELQQYNDASKIVEYVDKRWPRYYVENPTIRRVAADIAYKLGEYEKARDDYLWFYNLLPGDASNDLVLARLGDVSAKLGNLQAAREYYDMAIRLYPGREGALMAMMRLAEQGINDAPTLQEMFKAFADPKDIRPDKIYEIITNEYPKSALAPLALLKLSMWRLYKQEYPETLDLVKRFTTSYPGDALESQAVDVGAQAFGKMIGTLLEEMNYKRILELWRNYPFLAGRVDTLPDRERLGVALALYYQGAPKEALAMCEPYLDKPPTPDAQKALALILTIYRENQDWQAILETLRKAASWKLGDNPRRALEFAQAMALEHTGDKARSRLLWARLAADPQLDPAKRAYAVYYQARTALERRDYGQALVWAQDSRALFKEEAKDEGMARDALLLMIEANQAAGSYREALALCAEYAGEAPEKSAEWGANRLRMAKLNRMLGDLDTWRKILVELRDNQGDTLYGKLAASELAGKGIEDRAGRISGPP
ncbi:tetratricopeptide repeat protein [Fundidesulfovibrio terrae]|uniref:tetratricopeptide repeat protein n=1 Tax=Fundidesulfovibrio terrae TaxID=2922866 RepID=UPI001FAFB543|nr:tetratricopeptide repeat protein [Fundidesulfovibrio terrae]